VGKPSPGVSVTELVRRVQELCTDLAPINACVEIHGGLESQLAALGEILRSTPVKIVIDLENMYHAGLNLDELLAFVPIERVAYFHQRNLPGVWIEHRPSLKDESRCHELFPNHAFLWEPKTVEDPKRIEELFCEYRTSY
jgi:hypothetical protein